MGSGGGGGGKGGNPYEAPNYQAGYSAFTPGGSSGIDPSHPEAGAYQGGWDAAAQQHAQEQGYSDMMAEFMAGMTDGMAPPGGSAYGPDLWKWDENASFGDVSAGLGDLAEGELYWWNPASPELHGLSGQWGKGTMDDMKEGSIAYNAEGQSYGEGMGALDTEYGNYLDAYGAATDYVDNAMSQEASNAALLGIDYIDDPEARTQRIDDQFASIWGDSDQTSLQGLIDNWGAPQGFDGWLHGTGNAAAAGGPEDEGTTDPGQTSTTSASSIIDPALEDEDLSGGSTLLG